MTQLSTFRLRALGKKVVVDDNFSYFSFILYVVTPHLNRLLKSRRFRRGAQHMFYAELTKIIPNYHQILPFIYSSETTIRWNEFQCIA